MVCTTTTFCQIIRGFYYNYNYTRTGCAVCKFLFLSKYQQNRDTLGLGSMKMLENDILRVARVVG